jgi:hypothetical protein
MADISVRDERDWTLRHSAVDAPPLTPDSPGQRAHEVAGGVGERR